MKTWLMCLVVLCVTAMALPIYGGVITQDINADGKPEKISFKAPWLYITESGRELFYLRMVNCSYRFLDVDGYYPGKEIVTVEKKTYVASPGYSSGSGNYYLVTAYRYMESRKYGEFWTGEIAQKSRQSTITDADIKREWSKFITSRAKAVKFVQAVADGKWEVVKKLSDKHAGSYDYRNYRKACQKLPKPALWRAYSAPEDNSNRCFDASGYTLVVSPTGVKMFR